MTSEVLIAGIIYNTLENIDPIIRELGVTREMFLKNWCYSSKAEFSRKITKVQEKVTRKKVREMIKSYYTRVGLRTTT